MIQRVMTAPVEHILIIGEVHQHVMESHPHSFASQPCARCGEMTVEPYLRLVGGQAVCQPCQTTLLSGVA
jgi:formylmethanofuran dehydrogenase subunit E